MILADLFVYKIYQFLIKLGRNKSDAKFTVVCIISLYSTFFLLGLISIIGIIIQNSISRHCIEMDFGFIFITSIIFLIIWSTRYYRFVKIEDIINQTIKIGKKKAEFLLRIVYSLYILIPIFSFVFYRLYVFGFV